MNFSTFLETKYLLITWTMAVFYFPTRQISASGHSAKPRWCPCHCLTEVSFLKETALTIQHCTQWNPDCVIVSVHQYPAQHKATDMTLPLFRDERLTLNSYHCTERDRLCYCLSSWWETWAPWSAWNSGREDQPVRGMPLHSSEMWLHRHGDFARLLAWRFSECLPKDESISHWILGHPGSQIGILKHTIQHNENVLFLI